MASGEPTRAIRINIHPTSDGAVVVVLGRVWSVAGHRDREFIRRYVRLGESPTARDLGAVLRACSDALAEAADTL